MQMAHTGARALFQLSPVQDVEVLRAPPVKRATERRASKDATRRPPLASLLCSWPSSRYRVSIHHNSTRAKVHGPWPCAADLRPLAPSWPAIPARSHVQPVAGAIFLHRHLCPGDKPKPASGTLLRPPRSCRGRIPAPKAEELLQGSWVAELRSVWQPWRLETNYSGKLLDASVLKRLHE